MKKAVPFIIGFLCLVLFAVGYGFTNKTHTIYDNDVNTAQYQAIGVLKSGDSVTQDFVGVEDKLSGFMLKSDVLGNYGDVTINLKVYDAATGELLTQGQEAGSNVKARKIHYYRVNEIVGCKGKALRLELTEDGLDEANGVNFFFQPDDSTESGLIVKGNPTGGVLVMKSVVQRFDIETFLVMMFFGLFIWGFLWFLYRIFK